MPGTRTFTNDMADGLRSGSTLFERMRRATQTPVPDQTDIPHQPPVEARDLVLFDGPAASHHDAVRFCRGEVDGQPAAILQERDDEGSWKEIWSLPTESVDAREGMIGWLNTQSQRWDRFARMFHRRGGDELTHWIFELMVVDNTAQATAPRFAPQAGWRTIDQYPSRQATRFDDCSCRPGGIQHTRDF
jgi:hypothetical protein